MTNVIHVTVDSVLAVINMYRRRLKITGESTAAKETVSLLHEHSLPFYVHKNVKIIVRFVHLTCSLLLLRRICPRTTHHPVKLFLLFRSRISL